MKYKVIDLFCGIGGFSYGFEMTNKFEVILGADIWDVALDTFKLNHPHTQLIHEDITLMDYEYWNKYKGKVDVIIAGPPCQGFSMSGQRKYDDERNSLFKEVIRITKITQPKYVVIENVVGLLSMKNEEGQDIKELIISQFDRIGYKVEYKILNAADYMVPQIRKRVIFLITRDYDIKFPKPLLDPSNYVTVGDALSNIPPDGTEYEKPKTVYQELMSGRSTIYNHEPLNHAELIVKRMSFVPQGGNWKDIPIELGQGGGIHSNNYKRLDESKPSITIKHATKSMLIHPRVHRSPTVREVARLQSFNDNFIITGTKYDQHQQLANAVPPLLGKAIAEEIYKSLNKKNTDIITFIDLFSGLGGFRLAFEKHGSKCVFSSEIDKYAIDTYESNFGEKPSGDITKIDAQSIPDHDILCAGFPCQSFSIAGKRLGFEDTRGTLFFDVARILKEKRPKAFILENVKGITNHDKGQTLNTILNILEDLDYAFKYKVINALDHGVPQNRERWYCVGVDKKDNLSIEDFQFPPKIVLNKFLNSIIEKDNLFIYEYKISSTAQKNINTHIKLKNIEVKPDTLAYEIRPSKCQFRNNGTAPTLTAKMGTGGNNVPVVISQNRKLTERECLKLMGYPNTYKIGVGQQVYKQIGNSVVVPVIELLAEELIKIIKKD